MRGIDVLIAVVFLAATPLDSAAEPRPTAGVASTRECVIVLHGLARSSRSMSRLAKRLSDADFVVDNLDYASTREPFDELVAGLARAVERDTASCPTINFVGYSLGALLIRAYLQGVHPTNLGRVVMIGPPNHGSEIVDAIGGTWLFRTVFGRTGSELGTSSASLPARLRPPNFEFGVIAGNQPLNPLGLWLIRGENDGDVSVESTRLDGMSDFVIVPENHTFMMNAPEVARQAVSFLRTGHFDHDALSQKRDGVGGVAGFWATDP